MAGGPKSFDATMLEAMRLEYFQTNGNCTKTARAFHVCRQTISKLADQYGWPEQLDAVRVKTGEKVVRTVAEARAKIVKTIDKYLDAQDDLADEPGDKFDAAGVERLAKTRELLTGGATDRHEFNSLLKSFLELPDDEQLRVLESLKSISE